MYARVSMHMVIVSSYTDYYDTTNHSIKMQTHSKGKL